MVMSPKIIHDETPTNLAMNSERTKILPQKRITKPQTDPEWTFNKVIIIPPQMIPHEKPITDTYLVKQYLDFQPISNNIYAYIYFSNTYFFHE